MKGKFLTFLDFTNFYNRSGSRCAFVNCELISFKVRPIKHSLETPKTRQTKDENDFNGLNFGQDNSPIEQSENPVSPSEISSRAGITFSILFLLFLRKFGMQNNIYKQ